MNNINNILRATIVIIAVFLTTTSMAQLSKSELPKGLLVEKKDNTPRQMEFKGDKLIVRTDPGKTSGTQYMVEYKVVWNGKKFNLTSISEVSTTYKEDGQKEITTAKNADFFGYSYLKNWSIKIDEIGNYILSSASNKDYQWVFVIK